MILRILLIVTVLGLGAACTKPQQDNGVASANGGGVTTTGIRPAGVYDGPKWIKCLREHGLTVDDPNPNDPGGGKPNLHDELVAKEQLDEATKACQEYNTNWGQPNLPPDPADTEKLRKFAECMRAHGFDFDDPDPSYQTPANVPASPEGPSKPTPSGPQFDKALRECGELVPGVVVPEDGTKKGGK